MTYDGRDRQCQNTDIHPLERGTEDGDGDTNVSVYRDVDGCICVYQIKDSGLGSTRDVNSYSFEGRDW